MDQNCQGKESDFIYVKYITRNGRRIYPKKGKVIRFPNRKKKSA